MREEIGFGAGWSGERGQYHARGDITAEDEAAGAVTDILELAPLDLPGRRWQAGVFPFEGLDPGELVRARDPLADGG